MSAIIENYNQIAESFCNRTVVFSRDKTRGNFTKYLKNKAKILDAGCGSGRDTKAFREDGFVVEAIDGSPEIVKYATKYTGQPVRCLLFEEMEFDEEFDAIWASNSLVHHSEEEIERLLPRFIRALKPGGFFYLSLMHGYGKEASNNIFFHLHTEDSLKVLTSQFPELQLQELWVRDGTVGDEQKPARWMSCIFLKTT